MIHMPGKSFSGPLSTLTGEQAQSRHNLEHHVEKLASEIGERNYYRYDALESAAAYLETFFRTVGYEVSTQTFEVGLEDGPKQMKNIEAQQTGQSLPHEILIVGAHYDSVAGCPGANDNGTGIAALLEIARALRDRPLVRTVRFVAFVNEEPPFFMTQFMGSRRYAQRCRQRNEQIIGMLSLETIGYYTDEPGSQKYPFPFSGFYPSTGNFIGFVGNVSSMRLVRRTIGSFRAHTPFPSEGAAIPGWVTGVGWSDHWSFWQEGYPAVMITDTAPFRYEYYHTAEDTPDKIDYESLARVTLGLTHVVAELAGDHP